MQPRHQRSLSRMLALSLLAIVLFIAFGPRPHVVPHQPVIRHLPEDLDAYLTEQESHFPLRPETEKKIVWAVPDKRPTRLSIIYLHGFSASRREISPVVEQVAASLKANLFFTRLKGHGMTGKELTSATTNDWLHDSDEAYQIGKRLGDRVIVVGNSTGAALALGLAQDHAADIEALVLISPNFGLKDKRAGVMLWPWGLHLLRLAIGSEREWEPKNPRQAEIWTYRYPIEALVPMILTARQAEQIDPSRIQTPLLMVFTENDQTINVPLVKDRFLRFGSVKKELFEVREAEEHVLAGDATSPKTTRAVVERMVRFLE